MSCEWYRKLIERKSSGLNTELTYLVRQPKICLGPTIVDEMIRLIRVAQFSH